MGRPRAYNSDQVLKAIERWLFEHGVPPTIDELRTVLGVSSTRTVLRYLQELEEDGAIERWRGARGIKLLRSSVERGDVRTRLVPLLGQIPAGPLAYAEQDVEAWVGIPQDSLYPKNAEYFLLRVRGDSMNRARVRGNLIEDGDLVLVRREPFASDGDIVAALVDGEVTLKRLKRGSDYVLLKPESSNPAHKPLVLDRDTVIQGCVERVFTRGSVLLEDAEPVQ